MIDRMERNMTTEQIPTVGRIVLYRNAEGGQGVLPAIVQFTEDSYVPGYWKDSDAGPGGQDRFGRYDVDREWQFWVASTVPPVKEDCVHLWVFGHPGRTELNVEEDWVFDYESEQTPGTWRWPTRV